MKVRVEFFESAREITGVRNETLEMQDSVAVICVLRLLANKHGNRMNEYLFDPKTDSPRPYLQFLVNDKSIYLLQGLDTILRGDCILTILSPAGGG